MNDITDNPNDYLEAAVADTIKNLPDRMSVKEQDLAKLAREIAMDIREIPVILRDYGLQIDDFERDIKENPFFKRLLEGYIQEWNGALSTHQRLRLQAATALEYSLPKLAARMNKEGENLTAVIEAAKFFTKVAGIGEAKDAGNAGERFKIVIDLGADKRLEFEKESATAKTIDAVPLIEMEK